jgi:bifunctional DNA-binding transcriptional regulator/antitoxin component of YhaV-PrlF toxin-antitoxin module
LKKGQRETSGIKTYVVAKGRIPIAWRPKMSYHTSIMTTPPSAPPLPKTIDKEYLVRVNRKGMVTLPKAVRHLLQVEKKGQVVVRVEADQITLQELSLTLEEARGSVAALEPPKGWSEIKQIVQEERAKRWRASQKP